MCYITGENFKWGKFVRHQMLRWRSIIKYWLIFNRKNPVLVVTYEVLKNQIDSEVIRMLKFLNVEFDKNKLSENLRGGFNSFQRKKHRANFEHYTDIQRNYINCIIEDISHLLKVHGKSHLLTVDQYFMNCSEINSTKCCVK